MFKILCLAFIALTFSAHADFPTSFSNAKIKAEKEVYFDQNKTFYCGCDFVFDDSLDVDGDGDIKETFVSPTSCGYIPRIPISGSGKPNVRATRIEWEHVMPAQIIGGHLTEWQNPEQYPACQKSNGKYLSGRDCAYKVNKQFKKAHNDMNNLVPAVGELNGDRSNFQYATIAGELRAYGACDFEVDFKTDTAEPADAIKGNVARIYLYMMHTHDIKLSNDVVTLMLLWDRLDPVDEYECIRDERIRKSQHIGNVFVQAMCD
ncbi:endonuclease [Paraglaciecola sp. L3A3]|uniref:endonuclease n=1 Tax=Paraglaciecola sp. L3A3 TaxID=2686358 RepID=UPI00131AA9A1|nr:endonuclease [Paraglaciecola sp. L3A3]